MAAVVFFDTETTGLVEQKYPYTDDRQPWPVSLAVIEWADGKILAENKTIIKLPKGVSIHPKAEEVHGISFERTQDEGVEPAVALDMFISSAKGKNFHSAYNLPFDDKVMRAMMHRVAPPNDPAKLTKALYDISIPMCVMELTRTALRIPSATGTGFRNIKLSQAYSRICKMKLENAHDAMADTRAALEIFEALLKVPKAVDKAAQG